MGRAALSWRMNDVEDYASRLTLSEFHWGTTKVNIVKYASFIFRLLDLQALKNNSVLCDKT